MTFEQFQASGRDVPSLGAVLDDDTLEHTPGRVYLDALCIERVGSCWTDPDGQIVPEDHWYLCVERSEYTDAALEPLERILYEFALSAGYAEHYPNA